MALCGITMLVGIGCQPRKKVMSSCQVGWATMLVTL